MPEDHYSNRKATQVSIMKEWRINVYNVSMSYYLTPKYSYEAECWDAGL